MLPINSIKVYASSGRRISEIESVELSNFTPVKENIYDGAVSNTVAGNKYVASCKIAGASGYVYVAFAPGVSVKVGQTLADGTYAASIWQHENNVPKLVIEEID